MRSGESCITIEIVGDPVPSSGQPGLLWRLADGESGAVSDVVCGIVMSPRLNDATTALVRLASVLAISSDCPFLLAAIDACHAAGAEREAMREILEVVIPIVGDARLGGAEARLQVAVESRC